MVISDNEEIPEKEEETDDYHDSGKAENISLVQEEILTENTENEIKKDIVEAIEENIEDTEEELPEKNMKETIVEEIEGDVQEEINEEIAVEEKREPKTVILNYTEEFGNLDTAIDLKYSNLKINKIPINFSNIPESMKFPNELILGTTSIEVGNEKINNCYLTIISNEDVKILKVKHREFRFAFSVSMDENGVSSFGCAREYKISSKIKYSRMIKVCKMFKDIFSGAEISFKLDRIYGNITVLDEIELKRIETVLKFFDILKQAKYKFDISKLPESDNIYSLLEIYSAFLEDRVIETWCSFNLKKDKLEKENIDVNIGDSLILERKHKIFNEIFTERIIMDSPITDKNIFSNRIISCRKPCHIEFFRGGRC